MRNPSRNPYLIIERQLKGGTVYMARFYAEDGSIARTITLKGAKNKTAATRMAEKRHDEGVIPNSANPDAMTYLDSFWRRESEYVRGRALRDVILSERYLEENRLVIKKHLKKHLKGRQLLELTADLLESATQELAEAGVGPRRINVAMQAVRVPMAFFCKKKRIENPLAGLEKVAEHTRERGTLSAAELAKIIALKNESPRAKTGVLLGALCGLRLGECRGLLWEDIDEEAGEIHITHNFVDVREGSKAPKAGSSRTVPLPAPVLDELRRCRESAPRGAAYVLWNDRTPQSHPVTAHCLQAGFHRILGLIGIDEEARAARLLMFHGLRHTYVSLTRAGGLPDFIVQRLAGHKSSRMMENYSHAENVVDFAAARKMLENAVKVKKAK
jgi:integrase